MKKKQNLLNVRNAERERERARERERERERGGGGIERDWMYAKGWVRGILM